MDISSAVLSQNNTLQPSVVRGAPERNGQQTSSAQREAKPSVEVTLSSLAKALSSESASRSAADDAKQAEPADAVGAAQNATGAQQVAVYQQVQKNGESAASAQATVTEAGTPGPQTAAAGAQSGALSGASNSSAGSSGGQPGRSGGSDNAANGSSKTSVSAADLNKDGKVTAAEQQKYNLKNATAVNQPQPSQPQQAQPGEQLSQLA